MASPEPETVDVVTMFTLAGMFFVFCGIRLKWNTWFGITESSYNAERKSWSRQTLRGQSRTANLAFVIGIPILLLAYMIHVKNP